jgi:hypothetical protein
MNEKSLQFHIEQDDCFGTLATVLDLVSQDLRKKGQQRNAETLGVCETTWYTCSAPTGSKSLAISEDLTRRG